MSCAKTIEMVQKGFKEDLKDKTQIKELYKWFQNGRTSADNAPRSGRPSMTITPDKIERVRLAVED